MSKLEKLIQQYCPDGVEYHPLWSLTAWDKKFNGIDKSKQKRVIKYNYLLAADLKSYQVDEGTVKLLTTNISNLYTSEELARDLASEGEVVAIPWGGNPIVQYYKGRFLTADNRIATSLDTNNLNNKFLYYCMLSQMKLISSFYRGSGIKHPEMAKVLDLEIPVPPLPVQEEIVRVLDTFTELQAELQAELQKRLQQYEYYKKQVFLNCSCPIQYSIDEICTKITDGSHFSPKSVENGYHMPSVKDMLSNGFDFTSCKQISEEDYKLLVKNGCQPKVNDILIAKDGSMLKYAFPVSEEMPIVVLSSIAILSVNTAIVKPAFLAYYFKQKSFKDAVIREYSTKGGVPRIVLKNFKRIEVSIPSLEEQQRIVSILDRFDTLTNDLTSGLPAEMEKRRQQYEFYRDKLLTFKRKES